jgi:hypothetical protein
MIEFLCPEGHKIRCPEEKAGRSAKCPKCGVGFRIPTLEELGLAEQHEPETPEIIEEVIEEPASHLSPSASGKRSASSPAAPKDSQIEFLCPNGHHLHGPKSLQGKAGECPECGSRFRIPIIDEPEPEPISEPELHGETEVPGDDEITLESATHLADTGSAAGEALDFLQVLEGSSAPARTGVSGDPGGAPYGAQSGNGQRPAVHPLSVLFVELWALRDEGSRVEVHLESGSVLVPDAYVKSHSQHDYAVLVAKDPDGSSTVTVVPWKSISRIIMRALKQVPGEVVP